VRAHGWLIAATVCLAVVAAARDGVDRWVASTDLPALVPQTGTEVLDRNGALLRAYTVADGRWRLETALADVDPLYIKMLLAYEDARFFKHGGVDLRAGLRAAWQSARAGRLVSGGSTLTMQVARLLEESGTGKWRGKLRQIRVAWALERVLDKDQILTLYLHHAPYGGNIEGVRAAALLWFGKPARRLTASEAALLVALPQSPVARLPDRHPDAAHSARARVLARAYAAGILEDEAVAAAQQAPLPAGRRAVPQLAPHLTDRLRTQGGTVRTTVDAALQTRIEGLVQAGLAGRDPKLSMAVVVMDHSTGAGRASVGGAYAADGQAGFVDMTRALRSPGSTLKPLVYALGFDAGLIHPQTLIDDRARTFGTYAPQNFDRMFRGVLPVAEALQLSLNLPVVEVLEALGPAHLMAALERADVRAAVPGGVAGLAVGLGGVGMTLEGLVQMFGAFPEGGVVHPLYWTGAAPDPRAVTGEVAAWQIGDILRNVPPPVHGARGRIAYKTGTSYGHRDAWAVGFDGAHVVGVWLGRPDGTPVPGVFGADLAAPLLFEAFARIGPTVSLPPPPPQTLLLSNAALPAPLQVFRSRGAALRDTTFPHIVFPPDGAVLQMTHGVPLMPRVTDGTAPYTWLLNGAPVQTAVPVQAADLGQPQAGFAEISVIDAQGRMATTRVELRAP
jgi:penicillin-binding protein 1C